MSTVTAPNIRSAVQSLWWLVLLRGILLVVLGVLALVQPAVTVVSLVLYLGIYAVFDGVVLVVTAIVSRGERRGWGWIVVQGVISVLAGLLVLTVPGFTAAAVVLTILWFVVISAIVGGVLEIVAALAHRRGGWAIISGVLDILLGLVLMTAVVLSPTATALTLVWIFGIYAIVFGVVLVIAAIRIRQGGEALDLAAEAAQAAADPH